MSYDPTQGQGEPPRLSIDTVPNWLRARPIEKEPWFYGFLEKYAKLLKALSLFAFLVFAAAVLFPLMYPEASARVWQSSVASLAHSLHPDVAPALQPGRTRSVSPMVPREVASFVVRLTFGLLLVGIAFFTILLPTLLSVAFILLAVDCGRNLRALRREIRPPT
jgi:hypothetical protein